MIIRDFEVLFLIFWAYTDNCSISRLIILLTECSFSTRLQLPFLTPCDNTDNIN